MKDLNAKLETIKLIEENIGSQFLDISLGNYFLDLTPTAKQKQKTGTTSNWKLLSANKIINEMERQPMKWEKIFTNHISDKGLISKICNSMARKNKTKQNLKPPQVIKPENGQTTWTDIFPKVAYRWLTATWQDVQHHHQGNANPNHGEISPPAC